MDSENHKRSPRQQTRLPHSEEAERAVLGGIFCEASVMPRVRSSIDRSDFYLDKHQRIWSAMCAVHDAGDVAVDLVSVAACLKDRGELQKIGGHLYLSQMVDATPSASNIDGHARIVREKSFSRRVIEEAQRVIEAAKDPTVSIDDIPTRLSVEKSQSVEIRHVRETVKQLEKNIAAGYPGLPVCYDLLSSTIRKAYPGHLWIVGAYTSVGKSAWLVDFVCRMYRHGTINPGISIFSTEMTREQYLLRCLSNETAIPGWTITERACTADQYQRLTAAESFYGSRNLYLYDNLYRVEDIEATARRLKEGPGLDIIAIDYLQNLWGEGTIYERMSKISTSIQYLAKELKVAVICLSQVNRQHVREKSGGAGGAFGYKGAGEIEAVADLGIELEKDPQDPERMKFVVKKNRHGRVGSGELQYINRFTRLHEIIEGENE